MSEYSYNPITGKLDRSGTGDVVPSIITINSDNGPPITGDNFSIEGQKALVAPVMETFNTATETFIINNSWDTQYIVDSSTTRGLKGTFQTIQAAIDQIQIDAPAFARINIRAGLYIEDLIIPSAIRIDFVGINSDPNLDISDVVTIRTEITITGINGSITFNNINLTSDTPSPALFDKAGWTIGFNNCQTHGDLEFTNGSAGSFYKVDFTNIYMTSGILTIDNCIFEQVTALGSTTLSIYDCNYFDVNSSLIIQSTTNAIIVNCKFVTFSGSGTGNVRLFNTIISGKINYNGIIQYSNLLKDRSASILDHLIFGATTNPAQIASTQGNVVVRKTVAIDYNVLNTDYYIGVTDTSAPRSLVLPTTDVYKDQVFIINDESGLAGTNNITITVQGGALINGQSSAIIDLNYESLSFIFNGTNYFLLNSINDSAVTVNANSGSAITGDTFTFKGQLAGSIQVMDTLNSAGDTLIIDNSWVTQYIVDPSITVGLKGTFTTIQAAINAAPSGSTIYIRPGIYTENLLLKGGVNLTSFDGATFGAVTILGRMVMNLLGLVVISGIRLQTNGDNLLSIGGTQNTTVQFLNCYFLISGNVTGIEFSTDHVDCIIEIYDSSGDISDTNSKFFDFTSNGTIIFNNTIVTNGLFTIQVSINPSTITNGRLYIFNSNLDFQINTSGLSLTYIDNLIMSNNLSKTVQNETRLVLGGSGSQTLISSDISSGTASAIVVNTPATIVNTTVSSSNANAISGTGTLSLTNINFTVSSTINPTVTLAPLVTKIGTLDLVTGITVPDGGTGRITLTNHGVLIGAATGAINQTVAGLAGQVLQSGGASADPLYSTATFPATATGTGKILRADGTNWVATTATFPNTAGTAGKVLISDGTNIVSSTPTFPNASATSGKFIRSDGTNWIASTPTLPTTAGTTGKILQSDGTNYVESTPTYPSASGTVGKILRSDGTNNAYTTATYPATTTANQILYSSATNVIGEIVNGTTGQVLTATTGSAPAFATPNISQLAATTGTWSPVIEGASVAGTIAYNTRIGRYQKIGNFVLMQIEVSWTTIGTASGGILIKSFPFTFINVANNFVTTNWIGMAYTTIPGAGKIPIMRADPNTTQMSVLACDQTTGVYTAINIVATQSINFNFIYEV